MDKMSLIPQHSTMDSSFYQQKQMATQNREGKTPLHIAAGNRCIDPSFLRDLIRLADVNRTDNSGRTPLHIALKTDTYFNRWDTRDVLEWLISKTDCDIQDNSGRTPLHIAMETDTRWGTRNVMKRLISKTDCDIQDNEGKTPLHIAAENKDIDYTLIRELATRTNVNRTDNKGKTPLHIAAGNKYIHESVIRQLSRHIDVNESDNDGRTPLHIAVVKSNSTAFDSLLKHKANVNVVDKDGRTPLYIAVENSIFMAFELLLCGADWNIKDKNGKTPLPTGEEESTRSVLELLTRGVDVNVQDEEGRSLLHIAVKKCNSEAIEVLKDRTDANLQDKYGRTPLHAAVECSNSKALEVLIDKVDLSLPSLYGSTPLHTAVRCSNSKALEVLIDKADLNIPDEYGRTPLHTAVVYSNLKALEVLIDKVDLNLSDKDGKTPLHIASERYKENAVYANKSIDIAIKSAEYYLKKITRHWSFAELLLKSQAKLDMTDIKSAEYYLKEITRHWSFAELLLKSHAKLDIMDAEGATALDMLLSGIGEMKFLPDKRRDHVILLLKAITWREEYGYIPRIASAVVSEDKEDVFKSILDYTVSEEMLKDRASFIHNTDIKEAINEKENFIQSCLALGSVAKHIDEEDRCITTLFARAVAMVNIRNIEVCLRSVVNISRKDILYHLREAAWKAKNIEVVESITNIANLSKEEIDSIIEPEGSQEGIVLTPDISKLLFDIAKKDTMLATFISENNDNLIDAYFGTDVTTGSNKQTLVAILKCPPFEKFPDSKGYPLRLTHAFSQYRESIDAEYGKDRKERKVDIPTMVRIKRVVSKYADYMMKNHRNLNIIRRSSVISKAKSGTVKEDDCILLSCYEKGVIPDGDLPFPTSLEGIPVDVREGAFSLYAGTGGTNDATRGLKMGCMISKSEHDNCGTLGGFVQAGEDLCFLTCAHVLHNVDNCVNDRSYEFTDPFDVIEAGGMFTRCGEHVRSVLDLQSEMTVDASLVKICQQRLPKVGQFIYIPDQFLRTSGFSGAPVFNDGRCKFDINTQNACVKIGALSGITRGLPDVYGTVARQQEHIMPQHNQRLLYKGQFEIPATRQQPFAIPGDSGALVFSVDQVGGNENPTLTCVGMVVGGTSDFITLVTPIRQVLEKLGLNTDTLAVFNEEMEVDG